MTESWTCGRCHADNDSSSASCSSCGRARGAGSPTAEEPGPPPVAMTDPDRPGSTGGWGRWLRLAWIPVVAAVLLVGYFMGTRRDSAGLIQSAGTMSVADLRTGDCFNLGDVEVVSDVEGVPCGQAHAYEVFHVFERETPTYPTDAEFEAIFLDACMPSFEAYVGIPYESSEIIASMLTPTAGSFADGDRDYICYLFEMGNDALTGSQRGAAR